MRCLSSFAAAPGLTSYGKLIVLVNRHSFRSSKYVFSAFCSLSFVGVVLGLHPPSVSSTNPAANISQTELLSIAISPVLLVRMHPEPRHNLRECRCRKSASAHRNRANRSFVCAYILFRTDSLPSLPARAPPPPRCRTHRPVRRKTQTRSAHTESLPSALSPPHPACRSVSPARL